MSNEERRRWTLMTKCKDVKDWDVTWTNADDSKLLTGVFEYGLGSWEAIKMDPTYNLSDKVSSEIIVQQLDFLLLSIDFTRWRSETTGKAASIES